MACIVYIRVRILSCNTSVTYHVSNAVLRKASNFMTHVTLENLQFEIND